jgi:hypothetical protein
MATQPSLKADQLRDLLSRRIYPEVYSKILFFDDAANYP